MQCIFQDMLATITEISAGTFVTVPTNTTTQQIEKGQSDTKQILSKLNDTETKCTLLKAENESQKAIIQQLESKYSTFEQEKSSVQDAKRDLEKEQKAFELARLNMVTPLFGFICSLFVLNSPDYFRQRNLRKWQILSCHKYCPIRRMDKPFRWHDRPH